MNLGDRSWAFIVIDGLIWGLSLAAILMPWPWCLLPAAALLALGSLIFLAMRELEKHDG